MLNSEIAKRRADEIDEFIIETLKNGSSFRVEAGAGAGKTYSLMRVIDWLEKEKRKEYIKNGQHVACITYTNAAVDVIKRRLKSNDFILPCTIHNFAWMLIKSYQSSLIKLVVDMNLFPKSEDNETFYKPEELKHVSYDIGVKRFNNGILYLYHDDVIKLFAKLLDNSKFRSFLSKEYPIILIDEYQDSFRIIMDKFLEYFIDTGIKPQFGLFGDSWQTIYTAMGACGEVNSNKLVIINKDVNFRSQSVITNVLNNIRPNLPQKTADDNEDGRIFVITNDNYTDLRQSGYYAGELPNDILFKRIDCVREKLKSLGWNGNSKTLMLTHKLLAKEQHYEHLLDILNDGLKNGDDEHFIFFRDKVEPVFNALENNNPKLLFEALGINRRPVESIEKKLRWKQFGAALKTARNQTVYDVLSVVDEFGILGIPDKIKSLYLIYKNDYYNNDDNEIAFKLYKVSYTEVISAIDFQSVGSEFSTDHGVKGDEFDNVLFVIGRGWNEYRFDEMLYKDEDFLHGKDLDNYIKNRNLFYVCCSRPRKNLALFISVPLNNYFKDYLIRVFGNKNIYDYEKFLLL